MPVIPAQAGIHCAFDPPAKIGMGPGFRWGEGLMVRRVNARRWCVRTLALALLLTLPAFAASKNDEVDYLGLATLLTRDGEYARAEQALANIDPAAEEIGRASCRERV